MKDLRMLVLFIVICELAGFIGSIFTTSSIPTWYSALAKPSFSPPNWLFFPVWTILYLMMGISAYLVWAFDIGKKSVMGSLMLFFGQLCLNTLWSVVFFGMRSVLGGFIVIIALWFAIAYTIVSFGKISRDAAYMLFPYIMWVTFATILNFALLLLNPA